MTLPASVRARLIEQGRMTLRGVTRRAQAVLCRECRRPVVVGLDADRCALEVRCEPVALTPNGARAAWVNGRSCYTLTFGDPPRLDWRGPNYGPPAFGVIVASHVCGEPIPPAWRDERHRPEQSPSSTPDTCPW